MYTHREIRDAVQAVTIQEISQFQTVIQQYELVMLLLYNYVL